MKKYWKSKIEKSVWHGFFLQFYEPPDLGKKIFKTWDVFESEVYLACINFCKIRDDLKACFQVIRFPIWPETLKFSFFKSGPGSVYIPPKPIYLFKFSNFKGYP